MSDEILCGAGRDVTHPDRPGWGRPCNHAATGKIVIRGVMTMAVCDQHERDLDLMGVLEPPAS